VFLHIPVFGDRKTHIAQVESVLARLRERVGGKT
jgi:hypothetical protein